MIQIVRNLVKIDKNSEKTVKTRRGVMSVLFFSFALRLEARHVAVCLQGGQQDVDEPEGEEQEDCEELGCPWAPELAARDAGAPAVEQHQHTHHRHDGEEGDGEGQRARVHLECLTFGFPVNGGDGPRHPDAQENVHRVAARHVPDGSVGVLVLDGGHFTRKRVCGREDEKNRVCL